MPRLGDELTQARHIIVGWLRAAREQRNHRLAEDLQEHWRDVLAQKGESRG